MDHTQIVAVLFYLSDRRSSENEFWSDEDDDDVDDVDDVVDEDLELEEEEEHGFRIQRSVPAKDEDKVRSTKLTRFAQPEISALALQSGFAPLDHKASGSRLLT